MADIPAELHGWQERRKAQVDEYGTWRAAEEVYTDLGAMIYHKGMAIPASNVDDEGRVVVGRHYCPGLGCHRHDDPTTEAQCDLHNEITDWSEPGVAVRVKPVAGAVKPKPAVNRSGAGQDDKTSKGA
jgi:hypothetical protein